MNLIGSLGGRPVVTPVPGWKFGQPLHRGAAYLARRAAWEIARQLQSRHRVIAPWMYGTTAEFILSSDIGRCVWVAGCYEPNEMYFLSRMLEAGGTFVDVGANIGLYTLAAARMVGPGGRVLAFEPSVRERELLAININRNSLTQVAVDGRALGDSENTHAMLHLADDQHGGQNTLGAFVHEKVRLIGETRVRMTVLDQALAERGFESVDVVKMDVEGAEFAVLSGAHETLSMPRPVLMMELQDASLVAQGSSSRDVVGLLSSFDYDLYCYQERGGPPLLRRFRDAEATVAQDVVAVPAEKREAVLTL